MTSSFEIHEGTDRIVVLTKHHAIKFPSIHLMERTLEDVWHASDQADIRERIEHNKSFQRRILMGKKANHIEAELWRATQSSALVPTLSCGTAVNIQPRGISLRERES